MDKSELKLLISEGWIKCGLIFETQGITEKSTNELLNKHLDKIKKTKHIKVIEESFSTLEKTEPIPQLRERGINEVYSQILEIVVLAENFEELVHLTISFGPSALEVLEPEKIILSMRDAQNSLLAMAEMMHQFAASGAGGFIISK
ncbi:MAG: hypothetical protein K0B02_00230 [DPANN group archaeon]|nr:hypothetical protein [DPANN group archaeon]